jgi:type IV pilus assembly protein PilY1
LAIVPSVEFPTILSTANLEPYASNVTFVGYFDSNKCYQYIYNSNEKLRHFAPTATPAKNGACSGKLWVGNFLNWAATQTIDPFRKALTGGYRVKDTPTETWLEKANFDLLGRRVNFPIRRLPEAQQGSKPNRVSAATPATWGNMFTRLDPMAEGLATTGNQLYFTANGPITNQVTNVVAYNPNDPKQPLSPARPGVASDEHVVYAVSVRVKVCDPAAGLEENCRQYAQGYKPEGLLQANADHLRYSIFGYINSGGPAKPGGNETPNDGGVMRARQKFIGPQIHEPLESPRPNPNAEWDAVTGVQIANPDPADAAATGGNVRSSGVINYLNKFAQMRTGRTPKYYDNVSELYYAATRYFRGIGNVPEYAVLSSDATTRYRQADGFPVIASWDDPIAYSCQKNVILGIGDTNTWDDKNLPGNTNATHEPAKPKLVKDDKQIDVVKALKHILVQESFTSAQAEAMSKTPDFQAAGSFNSAYIAALAYAAHVEDIRPDKASNGLPGQQSIATYWVDVIEKGDYKTGKNQYLWAAKYGGFNVPAGYEPYPPSPKPLPDGLWWQNGTYIGAAQKEKRPDNFFAAADATRMVQGLTEAFESIVQEKRGSGSALAADSETLTADGFVYSGSYQSGSWSGDVAAYAIDPAKGTLASTATWSASEKLAAQAWNRRKIHIAMNGALVPLTWSTLSSDQQGVLGNTQVLDYLRGNRELEGKNEFRVRTSVLGDIVNSAPVYVGAPNADLYWGRTFRGAKLYQAYVSAKASRRPVVYVGANDGFVHGFEAGRGTNAGQETFAFMPASAITPDLFRYSRSGYSHHYAVDGELTVADVFVGQRWRTVLVGTRGRAGPGIYALDVTDPDHVSLLWELDGKDLPTLGASLGKPLIGQVGDGEWRVFLGNGPESAQGGASLISVDLGSGQAEVMTAGNGPDNGLSAPRLWDRDADGFIDTVYAGDMKGKVYRFKVGSAPQVEVLFDARGSDGGQAVTAAPLVARNPADGTTWVFFGTGKLLEQSDLTRQDVQSWYGLIDRGQVITGRGGLVATRILAESGSARAIDQNSEPGRDGWVMDLLSPGAKRRGERMVVPNRFQGRALIGTTRIPDGSNPCNPSGSGYIMAIDPFTGGRLDTSFFDHDGNGVVGNEGDLIDADGNPVPSSGYLVEQGPNMPIFVGDHLQVSLEDGSVESVKTNSIGNRVRRVSWREVVDWGH